MRATIFSMLLFTSMNSFSQGNFPWNNPLKMAWSNNGINFSNAAIFQDSSGVPSIARWKGDTLACVFQWFRQPMNSASWDRVAIKFSYNAGQTWTTPVPIRVNGLPANYQRPFDPALAVINKDSLRIYFSSSNGMPMGGLNDLVNTYSASTADGIHYNFEPGARFDHPTKPVIDPSVIFFNGNWHYLAPAGAPQDGAYHCTSTNGISMVQQANYASDNTHNWTGNFMLENTGELRFYGSGQFIWYNSSLDGFVWQGFVNTNLAGGDPAVIKLGINNYLAVYVGQPYSNLPPASGASGHLQVYPNPFKKMLHVKFATGNEDYTLFTSTGQMLWSGKLLEQQNFWGLAAGCYFLKVKGQSNTETFKLFKY